MSDSKTDGSDRERNLKRLSGQHLWPSWDLIGPVPRRNVTNNILRRYGTQQADIIIAEERGSMMDGEEQPKRCSEFNIRWIN